MASRAVGRRAAAVLGGGSSGSQIWEAGFTTVFASDGGFLVVRRGVPTDPRNTAPSSCLVPASEHHPREMVPSQSRVVGRRAAAVLRSGAWNASFTNAASSTGASLVLRRNYSTDPPSSGSSGDPGSGSEVPGDDKENLEKSPDCHKENLEKSPDCHCGRLSEIVKRASDVAEREANLLKKEAEVKDNLEKYPGCHCGGHCWRLAEVTKREGEVAKREADVLSKQDGLSNKEMLEKFWSNESKVARNAEQLKLQKQILDDQKSRQDIIAESLSKRETLVGRREEAVSDKEVKVDFVFELDGSIIHIGQLDVKKADVKRMRSANFAQPVGHSGLVNSDVLEQVLVQNKYLIHKLVKSALAEISAEGKQGFRALQAVHQMGRASRDLRALQAVHQMGRASRDLRALQAVHQMGRARMARMAVQAMIGTHDLKRHTKETDRQFTFVQVWLHSSCTTCTTRKTRCFC